MKIYNATPQYKNGVAETSIAASGGFADMLNKEIQEQKRIKSENNTKRVVIRKNSSSNINLNIL